MSELMAQFEQLSRLEAEAIVHVGLVESLTDRVSSLEECMLASKLVKVDDHGRLTCASNRGRASTPSLPSGMKPEPPIPDGDPRKSAPGRKTNGG